MAKRAKAPLAACLACVLALMALAYLAYAVGPSERLDARAAMLGGGASDATTEDLTLPGRQAWRGARHPVSIVIDEICEIFAGLGFTRARGP